MKFAGGILILCACVFYSYIYEKKQKENIRRIEKIYDFIGYIKSKIFYFKMPLDKIYREYDSGETFIENLIVSNFENHSEYFSGECDKAIYNLFSSVGKGLKNEEIALCEETLSVLQTELKKLKSEYPDKIKVNRALSLFCGMCTIILLI